MKLRIPRAWWPRGERTLDRAVVALRATDAGIPGGHRIDFVRVEAIGPDAGLRIAQQGGGPLAQAAAWHAAGVFRDAMLVLMLDAGQRQMLVLDQPEVPEAEQLDALRWPVAAALDAAAEDVLFDATPLPPLNDGGKRQVLAAAAMRSTVQPLLDALARAGLRPDAVDVADMAQRNAVLLRKLRADSASPNAVAKAEVVIGASGGELLVGLVAAGELCVARNLPLPASVGSGDDEALRDRLVLHVQRTVDLFERQITRFAIGGAFATAGDFSPDTLEALRQVLPGSLTEITLSDIAAVDAPVRASARDHDADATAIRLAALAALRCAAATTALPQAAEALA